MFNKSQIETFHMGYVKQIKYDNTSKVVAVFTLLLRMSLSLIFLL